MKSLILFAIIAAISIISQAAKQGGARGGQPKAASKDNGTLVQPTVAPHRSPSNQNTKSNMTQKSSTPVKGRVGEMAEPLDMEGVQTEGPKEGPSIKQAVIEEPVKEPGILDIGMDELQRSIIMAEVLGKPKALRKS